MKLSNKDKTGLVIIGAVFIVAVVILVLPALLIKPEIDEETLCPVGETYAQTFFLIDTTDKLDAREQRNLEDELKDLKSSLEVYERLSIFLISETFGGLSDPLFDKCSPRTGDNANALIEAERLLRRNYERKFGEQLDQKIEQVGLEANANRSPILEALADITQKIRLDSPDRTGVRVIVFSDMMQHTDEWSHYRAGATMDYESFANSRIGKSMMMDFGGAKVEILYLLRPSNPDPEQHRAFWTALLTRANADWIWTPIP